MRPFWTSLVVLGATIEDVRTHAEQSDAAFAGPTVSVQYQAGQPTAFGGDAWLLQADASVTGYTGLAARHAFALDASAALVVQTPLPFSRRHSLRVEASARHVTGTSVPMLVVGAQHPQAPAPDEPRQDPFPRDATHYALRGYNDIGWATNTLGLLNLTYLYPVIIDRGWTSLFYALDEPFIRQIDLELFAAGAASRAPISNTNWHRAAGLAATLRTTFFAALVIPFSVGYEVSYRFDHTQRWDQHIVAGFF